MTFYHPAMKSFADHHLKHGFLSMESLVKLEHPWNRARYRRQDIPARTLAFDTPERAAEWWAGAYGTEIVMLQIDGDATTEEGNNLLEGMVFLAGEIPADQVSLYEEPRLVP
jgi:hypothetical protein